MFRSKSAFLVPLFSLVASIAFAQRTSQSQCNNQVDIQVRVTYLDRRPAPQLLRVTLLNSSNVLTMETFTDDSGQARFQMTGCGNFRVKVTGIGIEEAVSDAVQITADARFMPIDVQVHPTSDPNSNSKSSRGTMTSASQLKIPSAARKSFGKGLEAFQEKNYKKAADLFRKATVTYPEYDAAYDNLGVALMDLGRADEARAAFERAVQLNDKNADADRNYSRLLISDDQYVAAKEFLQKALMVQPQDPSSLILLAIVQLRTGDYDGALHSALTVHHVSHEGYAVAHYLAGRAFENKHQLKNATTEYQMYLRESPDGPEASQVRAGLARVSTNAQGEPQ